MINILKFVILFAFGVGSSPAFSEQLSILVSERIEQNYFHQFPDNSFLEISFFGSEDLDVKIMNDFNYNEMTGQFNLSAIDENGSNIVVNGISIVMVKLPVPNRRILPDEIITENDISLIDYQFSRSGAFSIFDVESIVGYQARRMLAKGRPVAQQSITPPIVIGKGEKVNIVYRNNGMELSTKGKALDEGYIGKEIKIVNLVSHKTVVGVVKEKGIVEVIQ